jgi:hypothetical protein
MRDRIDFDLRRAARGVRRFAQGVPVIQRLVVIFGDGERVA